MEFPSLAVSFAVTVTLNLALIVASSLLTDVSSSPWRATPTSPVTSEVKVDLAVLDVPLWFAFVGPTPLWYSPSRVFAL
ncbi:hypothetical protein DWC19_00555 [Streptomyces sp. M7]|nr:hypothetical protein DWC19_00555 [Streptomyces sp. M7]